jgi:hypothetical protein
MKKRTFVMLVVATAFAGFLTVGCAEKKAEFGDKKEDWAPTKPPEGWKGPGQPGAPGNAPKAPEAAGK